MSVPHEEQDVGEQDDDVQQEMSAAVAQGKMRPDTVFEMAARLRLGETQTCITQELLRVGLSPRLCPHVLHRALAEVERARTHARAAAMRRGRAGGLLIVAGALVLGGAQLAAHLVPPATLPWRVGHLLLFALGAFPLVIGLIGLLLGLVTWLRR
ncbi:MAG: hypothetical protein ACPGUV_02395 [Polyangiales bacterium]